MAGGSAGTPRGELRTDPCPELLTEAGIRPYLKMLEKHGDLAHQLVSGKLIVFAIDGASVGQIPGWRYFRNALRDERHCQQMAHHGLRPGDSLGAWRDLPVEVPF